MFIPKKKKKRNGICYIVSSVFGSKEDIEKKEIFNLVTALEEDIL